MSKKKKQGGRKLDDAIFNGFFNSLFCYLFLARDMKMRGGNQILASIYIAFQNCYILFNFKTIYNNSIKIEHIDVFKNTKYIICY